MATAFTVHCEALPPETTVLGFRAHEAISEPFVVEIGLRTARSRIDVEGVVGRPLGLEVQRDGPLEGLAEPHRWHGIVASLELVHEDDDVAYWIATIVPAFWRLRSTMHSRIFTAASVPEIVQAVLAAEGLGPDDVRLELRGRYPTLDHVCTFREPSFDFVSRLLEREGISYSFEHHEDRHVMVLVDDPAAFPEGREGIPMIPYAEGDLASREGFFELTAEERALPGALRVTDYDDRRPSTRVAASRAVQVGSAPVVVEHGTSVLLPAEEARYAAVRAQELACRARWHAGWGRVSGLRPGVSFSVRGHLMGSLSEPLLAVELDTEGFALDPGAAESRWVARLFGLAGRRGVLVDVGAIPRGAPFRPARTTPWPRIPGVVEGVIDGPADSPYAQLDADGRYKVRLRFDESDLTDGSRSTWIRMLQPHGGAREGFHLPLRKGTEVHVAFLGGDPDRPVIVGAVPNAIEQSKVRRSNATQNVLHTGGDNVITLEDAEGGQFVTTSTPTASTSLHLGAGEHQLHLRTDGRAHLHVGGTHDVDVLADKAETVARSLVERYARTLTLSVTGAVSRTMDTSLVQTVTGPVTEHVTGPLSETVGASVTEAYAAGLSTTVTGGVTLRFGGTLEHGVHGGPLTEVLADSRLRMIGGTSNHHTTDATEETFGATVRIVAGDLTETVAGTYTVKAPEVEIICTEDSWIDTTLDVLDGYHAIKSALTDWTGADELYVTGLSDSITGVAIQLHAQESSRTIQSFGVTGPSAWAAGIAKSDMALWKSLKGGRVVAAGLILYM